MVVRSKSKSSTLYTVRSFALEDADRKLYMLCQFKHRNILESYETFSFRQSFYVISEHVEISCNELVIARPDEGQLANIIKQVGVSIVLIVMADYMQALGGISYLASQNLTHGSIDQSNVLLTREGIVKISRHTLMIETALTCA